jgi:5-methylcytosine-specific restriction endonuclease McrA
MTNQELEVKLKSLTREERRITNEILHLIGLADERRLYLERGYPSLFEWLRSYGYSEGAANRRIQAARVLRAVPEVSRKLADGEVNLTTLAKAQSVMRAQEKATGQRLSAQDKAAAIAEIEGKSTEQAERALLSLFPKAASPIRQERMTIVDENTARLAVNLSNETLADLQKIKDLLSHSMPEASFAEVIAHLAKNYLAREKRGCERRRKNESQKCRDERKKESTPFSRWSFAAALSRCGGDRPDGRASKAEITPRLKKQILSRDGGCTYKDPRTGKVCGSTYQLQVDHIYPKALGGSDRPENLRGLCRKHNLLMAEKTLGTWVKRYRVRRSAAAATGAAVSAAGTAVADTTAPAAGATAAAAATATATTSTTAPAAAFTAAGATTAFTDALSAAALST